MTSVGISFIHTADWQIGKLFGTIPDEARALLARQRIETIKRIADLANDNDADAVLVAGDVFETIAVADETIRRTVNALEAFRGPWVLLPGNHDAALAESPWTRMRRFGLPENVILATVPEPIGLANGRLTILPAPLQRRHEAVDLTAWFDAGPSGDGAVRVGLAHGSIAGFLPAEAEAQNPIAHDRAERARLDYLALGDWHGTLQDRAPHLVCRHPRAGPVQGQRPGKRPDGADRCAGIGARGGEGSGRAVRLARTPRRDPYHRRRRRHRRRVQGPGRTTGRPRRFADPGRRRRPGHRSWR